MTLSNSVHLVDAVLLVARILRGNCIFPSSFQMAKERGEEEASQQRAAEAVWTPARG